jgi:hypothetical protein
MNIKNLIYIIVATITLFACQTRNESLLDPNTGAPISKKPGGAFGNEAQYENEMKRINADPSLLQIRSLTYSNDNGESQSVNGLIDENGEILKLSQEYSDAKGTTIAIHCYFKNKKLISAINKTIVSAEKKSFCREIKSYYGENEKVVYSCSRKAKSELGIEKINFIADKKYNFGYAEAMEILKQTGRFETRFLSFMNAAGKEFIVVGTSGKDAYFSVLAIQPDIKAIQLIQADEKKYVNKLLKVEFTEVTEADGFTFQGLLNAEIIEK